MVHPGLSIALPHFDTCPPFFLRMKSSKDHITRRSIKTNKAFLKEHSLCGQLSWLAVYDKRQFTWSGNHQPCTRVKGTNGYQVQPRISMTVQELGGLHNVSPIHGIPFNPVQEFWKVMPRRGSDYDKPTRKKIHIDIQRWLYYEGILFINFTFLLAPRLDGTIGFHPLSWTRNSEEDSYASSSISVKYHESR